MSAELVDRFLAAVRSFPGMGAADSRSLRSESYVGIYLTFRSSIYFSSLSTVFGGFVERLYADRHGTLDSYLRDVMQEGSADAMACLPVPRV
jgi:hypothetical protein